MDQKHNRFGPDKRRFWKSRFLKKQFRIWVAVITYVPRLLAESFESDTRRFWTIRFLKERFRIWLAETAAVPPQLANRLGADKSRFRKQLFRILVAAITYVPRLLAVSFADDIR